jgi:hypothetical protein
MLLQNGANAHGDEDDEDPGRVVEAAANGGHTNILWLLIGSGLDLARWGAELIGERGAVTLNQRAISLSFVVLFLATD